MNISGMKVLSINENKEDLSLIEGYGKDLALDLDSFENTQEALVACQSIEYDLVLINYEMSEVDALAFMQTFRRHNTEIPIILLTKLAGDVGLQEKALRLGAHDFLSKPINPLLFQARIQNALKLKKSSTLLKNEKLLIENEIKERTQTLKDNEQEALQALSVATAYKEHTGNNHTLRISHYCMLLAKESGLNEKVQDIAFHASAFYDLGKVGVPDEILLKPSKLEPEEFEIVKGHARIGYDILKYSQSGYLKAGAVISYSHHEKYDGSGYPIGLKGETIPVLGRIVAIVDVFDAITQDRIYKKADSVEEACKVLQEEKGKHFDPDLVDCFIKNLDEIKSIKEKFSDLNT